MLRNSVFSGYKFFVITIITKHSIVDVAAALDPPLKFGKNLQNAESFQL